MELEGSIITVETITDAIMSMILSQYTIPLPEHILYQQARRLSCSSDGKGRQTDRAPRKADESETLKKKFCDKKKCAVKI